jgi:hypothetical protein
MSSSVPALIEPLTPPDCDLRSFPTMPLAVQRLRDSTMADNDDPEVFRAAVLLWCAAWHQVPAASLPNDDKELARLAGFRRHLDGWKKIKEEALSGFVLCSDGRLYHRVVAEVALPAWETRKRFLERSRRANEAKYGSFKEPAGTKARRASEGKIAKAAGVGRSYKESLPSSQGSQGNESDLNEGVKKTPPLRGGAKEAPPKAPPRAKKKKKLEGTRLPVGWYAKPEERAYAAILGFMAAEIDDMEEEFRLWWPAQPGVKGRKTDWSLTWKTWCRTERKRKDEREKRAGARGRGSQSTDRIGALHRGGLEAADRRAREQPKGGGSDQGES